MWLVLFVSVVPALPMHAFDSTPNIVVCSCCSFQPSLFEDNPPVHDVARYLSLGRMHHWMAQRFPTRPYIAAIHCILRTRVTLVHQ